MTDVFLVIGVRTPHVTGLGPVPRLATLCVGVGQGVALLVERVRPSRRAPSPRRRGER